MKSINLTRPLIIALHAAIMAEYKCCLSDIIGVKDTSEKMVAVFFLRHFYDLDKREIARVYSMNTFYVDTVVGGAMRAYADKPDFANMVHRILNYIERHCDETAA